MLKGLIAAFAIMGGALASTLPEQSSLFVQGASSTDEAALLQGLVNEAQSTIRSKEFDANLRSLSQEYGEAFASTTLAGSDAHSTYLSISELADLVSGRGTGRYVYSPVIPVGGSDHYMDTMISRISDSKSALFTIGRGHLNNWTDERVIRKSCAVNTVAHEISHLVSTDPDSFTLSSQVFRDFGAGNIQNGKAVASYLIGTVAQCTWLQRVGYQPSIDLKTCVKVFGHRGFNSGRCTQFANGQKIELRSDLFEEHVLRPD